MAPFRRFLYNLSFYMRCIRLRPIGLCENNGRVRGVVYITTRLAPRGRARTRRNPTCFQSFTPGSGKDTGRLQRDSSSALPNRGRSSRSRWTRLSRWASSSRSSCAACFAVALEEEARGAARPRGTAWRLPCATEWPRESRPKSSSRVRVVAVGNHQCT